MNNTETRPLDTNGGWEQIVNDNAAQRGTARARMAALKLERRIRKLQISAFVLGASALAFVILGAAGAIAGWLTSLAAIVCLAAGCFQFGRYVEARNK